MEAAKTSAGRAEQLDAAIRWRADVPIRSVMGWHVDDPFGDRIRQSGVGA